MSQENHEPNRIRLSPTHLVGFIANEKALCFPTYRKRFVTDTSFSFPRNCNLLVQHIHLLPSQLCVELRVTETIESHRSNCWGKSALASLYVGWGRKADPTFLSPVDTRLVVIPKLQSSISVVYRTLGGWVLSTLSVFIFKSAIRLSSALSKGGTFSSDTRSGKPDSRRCKNH